jgi:hypothetical protein
MSSDLKLYPSFSTFLDILGHSAITLSIFCDLFRPSSVSSRRAVLPQSSRPPDFANIFFYYHRASMSSSDPFSSVFNILRPHPAFSSSPFS